MADLNAAETASAGGAPAAWLARSNGRMLATVAIVAATVVLPFLGGQFRTLTRHEVIVEHPAQRILDNGDWMLPRFGADPWVDKPPLTSWLVALAMRLGGGFSETAARLPAALSSILLAGLVALLGRRLYGPQVGLYAGLAQATCVYVYMQGRLGEVDMPFTLLIAAAHAALAWSWGAGQLRIPRVGLAVFHVMLGLAILTKGPLAVLLVGASVLAWCGMRASLAPLRQVLFTPALALSMLIGASWHIVVIARLGWHGFDRLFFTYVARGMGLHHLGPGEMSVYVTNIPWMLLPWTVVLAMGARELWTAARRDRAPADRFLWSWFLGGFALLMLMLFKHKHYAIPILPPLSILAGAVLAKHRLRWPWAARVHVVLIVSMIVGYGIVSAVIMPRRDHRRATIEFVQNATARLPADARLYLIGLAQSAIYPYVERPHGFLSNAPDVRAALREAGDAPVYLLSYEQFQHQGETFGLYLVDVVVEPQPPGKRRSAGDDDDPQNMYGSPLVLGRVIVGAPATSAAADTRPTATQPAEPRP